MIDLDRFDALIYGARRGLREAEILGVPALIAVCREHLNRLRDLRERLGRPDGAA